MEKIRNLDGTFKIAPMIHRIEELHLKCQVLFDDTNQWGCIYAYYAPLTNQASSLTIIMTKRSHFMANIHTKMMHNIRVLFSFMAYCIKRSIFRGFGTFIDVQR